MVLSHGLMEGSTGEVIKTTKNMVTESFSGQMGVITKENGKMDYNTAKECSLQIKGRKSLESGKMAKDFDG